MNTLLQRPRLLLAVIAFLSLASVGIALVSQHVYGMEPCPWCVLQRLIFVLIAIVCLIGLVAHRLAGALVLALSLGGIGAALWQHFQAATSSSCAMTVADRIVMALKLDTLWPDVFLARASCADAVVDLLGIPYDFWSGGLFAVLAVAAGLVLVSPRR